MPTVNLAMFDLDHTLLEGDSEVLWVRHLIQNGYMNASDEAILLAFYDDYTRGDLDIEALQKFILSPLLKHDQKELADVRTRFVSEKIVPIVRKYMRTRLAWHRNRGDVVLMVTATNRFITEPIADLFAVDDLIATIPERVNGRYTGNIIGTPCFQEGKVENLMQWMGRQKVEAAETWFYSDSHNDIPLLEWADHPVAVTPDQILLDRAKEQGWKVMPPETGAASQ